MANTNIKTIGIFCGSSKGTNINFELETRRYVKLISDDKINIVYGAGNIGIMGVVAKAANDFGVKIIGIAPYFLKDKEVVDTNLDELILVNDMFERKKKIMDLADAFTILPGGIGTMDEFFEVLTANQLGIINKPIGILNISGYYDYLIKFIEKMIEERFYSEEQYKNVIIASTPEDLHKKMKNAVPQSFENWIEDLRKKERF